MAAADLIEELYIAEKPSVGKAIAEVLAKNAGTAMTPVRGSSGLTNIVVGNRVVTWVFGHVLELFDLADYDAAFGGSWESSASRLPYIPEKWELKPVAGSRSQLDVIRGLIKRSKCVIHAGDPDREGQLLVDEVLVYLGNTLPVNRILPNAIDAKSMQKILSNVLDNTRYLGLYRAGVGRQRADFMVGTNVSRACSVSNQRGGMHGTLTVGRVQTPTLALVVRRDLEIENFKSETFFTLTGSFQHPNGPYFGKWVAPRGLKGLDAEGRLLDMAVAAKVKSDCEGKPSHVNEYKVEDCRQSPPLPFSLSGLQKKASEVYKLSAATVLETCQSLYEKKIATYPRTDCAYLPEDQWGDAKSVLAAVAGFDPSLAAIVEGGDASLKSSAWNTTKVSAHHAIVPTSEANYVSLTVNERKVFSLIVKQFVAQFYPDYLYRQTSIVTSCAGYEFKSSGRTPVDMGWRKVFGAEERAEKSQEKEGSENDESQMLPTMMRGDQPLCQRISVLKKLTKPPDRFSDGTLIHAMTNVHEMVSDPEIKKKLKEVKGLGTEATRSDIIETLKKRMFVSDQIQKDKLVSTPAGRAFIQALPRDLTDVTLTALWESALDQIERGSMTLEKFVDAQAQWVRKLTRQALESKMAVAVGLLNAGAAAAAVKGAGETCGVCGKGTMRVNLAQAGPNKGSYFLSCSTYPECKNSIDIDGQEMPKKRASSGGSRKARGDKDEDDKSGDKRGGSGRRRS